MTTTNKQKHTIADRFKSLEQEYSLFDIRIDSVPIWERIRFHIYRQIKQQNGTGQAHTGVDNDWRDYIRGGGLFLKNLFINNPYLADQSDVLYLGHHRRKKQEDGHWWDLYCDPIHEACDHEYVQFERPHLLDHYRPARTSNLRYLDLIEYGGTLQRLLGLHEPEIPQEARSQLVAAGSAMEDQFDADVDLLSQATEALHVRRTTLPLYRRLLERVDPELAVIVVSYGNETFIEACKRQNVRIAELQHGVINENHLGYSYSGSRTKEMFPDYLLTFGEFWTDVVEFPIPDDQIIPVGYPYLEQFANTYDNVETKNQLLFISQGVIGEQLSKFAVAVDQSPDIDHNIVYKLHPGEYDRWRTEYPWLAETEITVIDSSEPALYRLFSESSGQVGVYSTAVYEGLQFDLKTYLYDCPGEETLQPLLDNGTAILVSSVDQLVSALKNHTTQFDREQYFSPNATSRMCDTLSDLKSK